MPSGAKKRKAAKRKKELASKLNSNSNSLNGEDDSTIQAAKEAETASSQADSPRSASDEDKSTQVSESDTTTTPDNKESDCAEGKDPSFEHIQSAKEMSDEDGSSGSYSEEGPQPIENPSQKTLTESMEDVFVAVVSVGGSIDLPIENSSVSDVSEEEVAPPLETSTEKAKDFSECHEECKIPESRENELCPKPGMKQMASDRPLVRPTSWMNCCGLFDLFTHR